MRALACAVFCLTTSVVLAQNTSHDVVLKDMIGMLSGVTEILKPVVDRATSDAARPQLRKWTEEWRDARRKAEKLPPPTKEQRERIVKEYRPRLEDAHRNFFTEMERIKAEVPGGRDMLADVFKDEPLKK